MTHLKVASVMLFACVALAACAGSKGPAAGSSEATPALEAEVTANSLNVRESASATAAVVGSVKRGDRVFAPKGEADGWVYIETDGGLTGYVSAQYVRILEGKPAAAAPAAATPAAAKPAAEDPKVEAAKAKAAAEGKRPPPGTRLARITDGMSEAEVISILGEPTSQQNYMTGKAWIPYYYGSDVSRLDYRYKGTGIVVFGRNRYSGKTRVIRVDYDPSEDGYP
jgi:hypothetical protein